MLVRIDNPCINTRQHPAVAPVQVGDGLPVPVHEVAVGKKLHPLDRVDAGPRLQGVTEPAPARLGHNDVRRREVGGGESGIPKETVPVFRSVRRLVSASQIVEDSAADVRHMYRCRLVIQQLQFCRTGCGVNGQDSSVGKGLHQLSLHHINVIKRDLRDNQLLPGVDTVHLEHGLSRLVLIDGSTRSSYHAPDELKDIQATEESDQERGLVLLVLADVFTLQVAGHAAYRLGCYQHLVRRFKTIRIQVF